MYNKYKIYSNESYGWVDNIKDHSKAVRNNSTDNLKTHRNKIKFAKKKKKITTLSTSKTTSITIHLQDVQLKKQ